MTLSLRATAFQPPLSPQFGMCSVRSLPLPFLPWLLFHDFPFYLQYHTFFISFFTQPLLRHVFLSYPHSGSTGAYPLPAIVSSIVVSSTRRFILPAIPVSFINHFLSVTDLHDITAVV